MSDAGVAREAELAERFGRRGARPLLVWGAGRAGQDAAAALAGRGVDCAGFIDRDPAKAGMSIDGRPVLAPDDALRRKPRPRVLIASMYWREIAEQLRRYGFRPRRDFDVFGNHQDGLHAASGSAHAYAVWRHDWAARQRLGEVPSAPVRRIAVPATPRNTRVEAARSWRRALLRRLPVGSDWVVLFDDRVRSTRWRWTGETPPPVDVCVGGAAYDWMPPAAGDRDRPFLLQALASAAALAAPVLCRAGAVRAWAAQRAPGDASSIQALQTWLTRQYGRHQAVPAGALEIRHRRPRVREARIDASSPVAPGLIQFALHTAESGVPVFAPDEVVSFLPHWTERCLAPGSGMEYLHQSVRSAPGVSELNVLTHSRGNFFFEEIRDFLAAAWRRAGVRVSVGDERSRPRDRGCRNIVVAPHEFFVLDGRHPDWDARTDLVLINTEQPQTRWFAACLRRLVQSALVLDLNWQTTLLLRTLGIKAYFLPLGWDSRQETAGPRRRMPASPAFIGLSGDERRMPPSDRWNDRPIDVLFVGTLSPRRARAFAEAASTLARYRCFLHLPPSARPLAVGSDDSLDARDMADLCRRTKIVLNIHRDELPYCEWHRLMFQAMRHGALVLTEPMMPVPEFRPGRHYLAADLAQMRRLLPRLLTSAAGARQAARVAAAGSHLLRQRFSAERIARRTLRLM